MNNGTEWYKFVPALMKYYNSMYQSDYLKNRKRVHILFVEGVTDKDFYVEVFSKKSKDEKLVLCLEFDDDRKIKIASFPVAFLKMHGLNVGDVKYYKYEFVIKCLETFNSISKEYSYIDCFGFIDRDFYHYIDSIKQLKKTTEHDRETNLIRCYMPDYIGEIKIDKDYCVELFCTALMFSLQQGILEKTSFDYQKKYNDELCDDSIIEDLKTTTHRFFMDQCGKHDFTLFDFDKYIKDNNDIFDDKFFSLYKKNRDEIKYLSEIPNLVAKWLLKQELKDFEETRLNKILELCNGHILIQQLLFISDNLFKINDNDYFDEDIFVDNLKGLLDKDISKIYNLMPLKDYYHFRKDNNYLYKKSFNKR